MESLHSAFSTLDEHSAVLYLEVPRTSVVLLQVFFELYDGVGAVRTVTSPEVSSQFAGGLVCILSTPGQIDTCCGLLSQLKERVPWRIASCPNDPFIIDANRLPV